MYITQWLFVLLFISGSVMGMEEGVQNVLTIPKCEIGYGPSETDFIVIFQRDIKALAHPFVRKSWEGRPEDCAKFVGRLVKTLEGQGVTPDTVWNFFTKGSGIWVDQYPVIMDVPYRLKGNQVHEAQQIEEMGSTLDSHTKELVGVLGRMRVPHPVHGEGIVLRRSIVKAFCEDRILEFWREIKGSNEGSLQQFKVFENIICDAPGRNDTEKIWGVLVDKGFRYRDSLRKEEFSRFSSFQELFYTGISMEMLHAEALEGLRTAETAGSLESYIASLGSSVGSFPEELLDEESDAGEEGRKKRGLEELSGSLSDDGRHQRRRHVKIVELLDGSDKE